MRIVVSGTHASGKSTLISDFTARHPEFTMLPDPFDLIDEAWDGPSPGMFAAQLRIAADRLLSREFGTNIIAERGPLDFLAYLIALEEVGESSAPRALLERAATMTADALAQVDLLVILPLTDSDPIRVTTDEHVELRAAMNDALLDLTDDVDLLGERLTVVEITGDPAQRLAALEVAVNSRRP